MNIGASRRLRSVECGRVLALGFSTGGVGKNKPSALLFLPSATRNLPVIATKQRPPRYLRRAACYKAVQLMRSGMPLPPGGGGTTSVAEAIESEAGRGWGGGGDGDWRARPRRQGGEHCAEKRDDTISDFICTTIDK
ncbi:hypothetical protein U1Q18_052352 [Sarracenia purpurea var. burkii]